MKIHDNALQLFGRVENPFFSDIWTNFGFVSVEHYVCDSNWPVHLLEDRGSGILLINLLVLKNYSQKKVH